MKTAVIYARYSSDKQREESIEGQIRECTDYAKRQNINIIHTYIDRALSARTDHRPEFLKMIRDSARRTFDYVIVYQLDRFSRSRYDSATYKARLKKYGVKVLSAKENISDDPAGILMESVLEGMAEYYSAELSQKVTRGMTENILNGKWPGGHAPLGYKVVDGKILIDDVGASAIRLIFELYRAGNTEASIISHLNSKGYRTGQNRAFGKNSTYGILTNATYTGVHTWNGHTTAVPAIISTELFQEVQEMRERRKKHHRKSDVYALTGLLQCQCGKPMTGTSGTSGTGDVHYYYRCTGKCGMKNIRRDDLEKLIVHTTVKLLNNDTALKIIASQCVELNKKAIEDNITLTNLKNRIDDLIKRLKNCQNAIEMGLITDTTVNRIKELETALTEANTQFEREKLLASPVEITEDLVYFFLKNILDENKTEKSVIDTFVKKIIVSNDAIEIRYNYGKNLPQLDNITVVRGSDMPVMVDLNGLKTNFFQSFFSVRIPLAA